MLGKPLKEEEAQEFDTVSLLGKPYYLTIVHNEYKDSVFANVFTLRKGDFTMNAVNPLVEFSLESFNKKTFDSLSDKTKEKIMLSPEYQEADTTDTANDVAFDRDVEELVKPTGVDERIKKTGTPTLEDM
jgi:hypothetical protein